MAEYIYSMVRARKAVGDKLILDDVTMSFLPGAKIGMVGPNGAGKSTLIAMLTGLVTPDAGTIHIQGANGEVTEGPGSDAIACVYQKSTLVPELTVAENISLGAYPRKRWGSACRQETLGGASAPRYWRKDQWQQCAR